MGIPLGWNIVRGEAKEKDVLRADVPGSRSPIRRRARGSRPSRDYVLGVLDAFEREAFEREAFERDALADASTSRFAQTVEHAPRLSHTRTQLPPAPPVPELDRDELQPRALSFGAAAAAAAAADDRRPLPALTPGFAPAGPRAHAEHDEAVVSLRRRARQRRAVDVSDTPEWLRWSSVATSRRGQPRSSPPRPASGGRSALGEVEEGASRQGYMATERLTWAAGRRHAPYARAARNISAREAERLMPAHDDYPSTSNAVSHPPLRRVGHRRIADGPLPSSSLRESWSPVSTLDGLGDRERSNSVSSTSSHLPWQTFLTTVVPDPVAPTAESSFASAAASASFTASSSRASSSNSNSTRSENTLLTVPSRHASPSTMLRGGAQSTESFVRACDTSDEDTASDTEDEAQANPLSRRRIRPSYFADEPPSPRRYGRNVMDQGMDARRYVRSYYSDATSHGNVYSLNRPNQHDAPVDGLLDGPVSDEDEPEPTSFITVDDDAIPATTPASPLDQELRDARSLLERLTRRDDVSEDFWASVGLTRSFADGVERVQERGRF